VTHTCRCVCVWCAWLFALVSDDAGKVSKAKHDSIATCIG